MDTLTELSLHQSLEQMVRAVEQIDQARAPIIEQLGYDRRRASELKAGDTIYVSEHHGYQELTELALGDAAGGHMVVMGRYLVEWQGEAATRHHVCWDPDEFVNVQMPVLDGPF